MIKGKPKGDGLCCYLAKESVDLALDILDGDIVEGHKISVRFHFFRRSKITLPIAGSTSKIRIEG